MARNKVRLHICGADYVISSEDGEAYIREIGEQVEKAVQEVLDSNPRASLNMAAVLAALTFCDNATKASEGADHLRNQLKGYMDEANSYREHCEQAKKKVRALEKQVAELKKELEKYGESDISQLSSAAVAEAEEEKNYAEMTPAEFLQYFSEENSGSL